MRSVLFRHMVVVLSLAGNDAMHLVTTVQGPHTYPGSRSRSGGCNILGMFLLLWAKAPDWWEGILHFYLALNLENYVAP